MNSDTASRNGNLANLAEDFDYAMKQALYRMDRILKNILAAQGAPINSPDMFRVLQQILNTHKQGSSSTVKAVEKYYGGTNISYNIKQLNAAGLIYFQNDEADKRLKICHVTKEGELLVNKVSPLYQAKILEIISHSAYCNAPQTLLDVTGVHRVIAGIDPK